MAKRETTVSAWEIQNFVSAVRNKVEEDGATVAEALASVKRRPPFNNFSTAQLRKAERSARAGVRKAKRGNPSKRETTVSAWEIQNFVSAVRNKVEEDGATVAEALASVKRRPPFNNFSTAQLRKAQASARKALRKRKRNTGGLIGKAKAAFLKRMAAGRKKAAKKAAKPVKRNAGKKSATRPKKTSRKATRKPRRRKNPEDMADAFYEKTHGHKPEKDTFVTERLKEHKTLVGMGKLHELVIRNNKGDDIDVTGFKGALLAMNEAGTQLYIKGGDQSVNQSDFACEAKHESQVLGHLVSVTYHTRKDHLTAATGGTGLYEHKFSRPLPTVIYDVRNRLLSIAGGAYSLRDVGVVR